MVNAVHSGRRRFNAWVRRGGVRGRTLVLALPWLWLVFFFLVPFAIVLTISFAKTDWFGMPPYTPVLQTTAGHLHFNGLFAGNYRFLFTESLYADAFLNSLKVAGISTCFCLLVGYPMAYGIARAPASRRNVLLLMVILPFWTSFLLRVYAWIGLLGNNGVVNRLLMALGWIHDPIVMLQTDFAMYVGIVYSYLPFMVLPLYTNLEKHDAALLEAAVNLGCRPWRAFLSITLPLSVPGIVAGSMLVFIPAVGEYVIPRMLGGPNSLMLGRVLWDEFFLNKNWPMASAVAVALLLVLVVPLAILQRYGAREARGVSAE